MIGAGLELHYWTINDAEEMKRLISLGAHGIVTDRTDIAVKTL
jgi:glycerophosphoryl diester phosphodiesterase